MRQIALFDQANAEVGLPPRQFFVYQGVKFFATFRQLIAEHTDTNVEQTTAAEYLKKLD